MSKILHEQLFKTLWQTYYKIILERTKKITGNNEEIAREVTTIIFTRIYQSPNVLASFETFTKNEAVNYLMKSIRNELFKKNAKNKIVPLNNTYPTEKCSIEITEYLTNSVMRNLNVREQKLLCLLQRTPNETELALKMNISVNSLRGTIIRLKAKIKAILY